MTARIRCITVMAPMLNEAAHIEALVADLAAQDWGGELEVLVADGGSSDGSVAKLRAAADRHGLPVTVIDNPERWVSSGLNRCIRQATGDLIVRVDCHSSFPPDYLRLCALAAEETGAENVGGILISQGRSPTQRAVAVAVDSAFGGIGWTRHTSIERAETDTVTFGAFRPSAFERAGLFDETLLRNQDDEFNLRLRLVGARVVIDPAIRVYYTPRGSFGALFKQYYGYGRWKAPVMRKHRRATSVRSLVPAAFVAGLAGLAALSFWAPAAWALAGVLAVYVAAALAFAARSIRRRRESWALLPRVAAAYPTMHVAHGIGMLSGWIRTLATRPARAKVHRPAPDRP